MRAEFCWGWFLLACLVEPVSLVPYLLRFTM